jgi:hypothetical protein
MVMSLKQHLASITSLEMENRPFAGRLKDILQERGLLLQSIALEDGDFPPVKGFDRWLHSAFGVPVKTRENE